MPSHRPERLSEAIREVVSTAILFEVADPRVKGVTVLGAEISPDFREATILVSVMGTESEQRLALRGLNSARGYLQSKLATRLQTRYTPTLTFKKDEGVKRSVAMSRLIDEVVAKDRPSEPAEEAVVPDEDDLD
jgi:ribosome-binding factor A